MSDAGIHAIAGSVGGIVAMAVTYPLVNLSTRAQVAARNDPRTSTRAAALKVIKADGISGLYDGLSSSLLGIGVTNGVYYLFFEQARHLILGAKVKAGKEKSTTLSTLESMLASLVAGCATSIASNPIWVVNTRQSTASSLPPSSGLPTSSAKGEKAGGKRKKMGVVATVRAVVKEDGITGLWHGLGPALVLVSNPILQFTLFEQIKNLLLATREAGSRLSEVELFILGAITKLFATGVTYPYLTIKSRLQAASSSSRRRASSVGNLGRLVREEGITGLYRGVGPKLIQSVLTAAILFVAKDRVYRLTKEAIVKAKKAV